jgi:hypothetical protein
LNADKAEPHFKDEAVFRETKRHNREKSAIAESAGKSNGHRSGALLA